MERDWLPPARKQILDRAAEASAIEVSLHAMKFCLFDFRVLTQRNDQSSNDTQAIEPWTGDSCESSPSNGQWLRRSNRQHSLGALWRFLLCLPWPD